MNEQYEYETPLARIEPSTPQAADECSAGRSVYGALRNNILQPKQCLIRGAEYWR